jgi:hypothetical protein
MRLERIVAMVAAAALLIACKDKLGPAAGSGSAMSVPPPDAPPARSSVDLSVGGAAFAGLTVQAPVGATAKASAGAVEVTQGDGFALRLTPGATDLAEHKGLVERQYKSNLFRDDAEFPYDLAPWVVDKADELVYQFEWLGGRKQVHFRANAGVGDRAFTCQDLEGGADKTLAQTQAMIASCKSLAASGAAPSPAAPGAGTADEPATPTETEPR